MKRIGLRSSLYTAAFVLVVVLAWWYFAPTSLGGSTRYVVTNGVSMEPRFHTGDLAIVRPASQYRVGDIAAYWSTLLHTVVLHRIIAIHGTRYVFKGDNNDFIDPIDPTRAELLGKLWLHVPRAGQWLNFVHTPVVATVICALLGTFLLFGLGKPGRRRKRRRKGASGSHLQGIPLVNKSPDRGTGPRTRFGAFLTASALAVAAFVVLGAIAFARPTTTVTPATTTYVQQITFGYRARARAGAVYPTGAIRTGDPIFLSLVHQLAIPVHYTFTSGAGHNILGTEEIVLQLTSQSGWGRTMVLTPPTRFTGDSTSTVVPLDLGRLESLVGKVAGVTGMPTSGYTIAIEPKIHISGAVGGQPLNLNFDPAMNFEVEPLQLVPESASTTSGSSTASSAAGAGSSPSALTATQPGRVGTPISTPASITFLGVSVNVSALRWISLLGLVMSAIAALLLYLRKRGEPFEESVRIQSQYGHLIVPVVTGEDLGWPPVDVPNIKALARLAESGQRLILHSRSDDVDTYMVNDEGTVYRYQVRPSKVVWGEWSENTTPVKAAA
ncbi:MAG TPA: signal peptidase I [Solirubrobacteraceae bacterium]|nr:signal peptidase I [Solirubrobacteraceae bacterium]